MRRTISVAAFAVLAIGCTRTVIITAPTPTRTSAQPSPSPTPQTPMQRLQAVLDANPQIQADVCYHSKQLLSVGWPDQLIPSLLYTFLTKSELAQLQGTGLKLDKVLADLAHRC